MNRLRLFSILTLFLCACQLSEEHYIHTVPGNGGRQYNTVSDIVPPPGYERMDTTAHSFGNWLRQIAVRKDDHVYLYNGKLKKNQSAQFAVLDISVGQKDLQQCADAVMRLRAEYLFNQKRYSEIMFTDNAGKIYQCTDNGSRSAFDRYLETVFGWCGSASLEKQLSPVTDISAIQPGDVFIKGGFPGHAMIVMDVAVNKKGNKVFMLAQSYMPAQDIHIVRNPLKAGSPWYAVEDIEDEVTTPEWAFEPGQLRRW
ncbi:MAG: hypothetical protein JNK14_12390 [Chitinophagaceae bacterium]|nr:hypothetical protein [Chitinophagaceae bacterium]